MLAFVVIGRNWIFTRDCIRRFLKHFRTSHLYILVKGVQVGDHLFHRGLVVLYKLNPVRGASLKSPVQAV